MGDQIWPIWKCNSLYPGQSYQNFPDIIFKITPYLNLPVFNVNASTIVKVNSEQIQAIFWTNDDQALQLFRAALCHNELSNVVHIIFLLFILFNYSFYKCYYQLTCTN